MPYPPLRHRRGRKWVIKAIRFLYCHTLYVFFIVIWCILLLLCLFILIVMYALFCIFCFHRANWHSPTTLTEVFPCFFLSCKANARVYLANTGARSALFLISEMCCSSYCFCRLCCSMYCLFVNVYCTTAIGCQSNCSLQIYHIIYHIPYHIVSYTISYHISYITSYTI